MSTLRAFDSRAPRKPFAPLTGPGGFSGVACCPSCERDLTQRATKIRQKSVRPLDRQRGWPWDLRRPTDLERRTRACAGAPPRELPCALVSPTRCHGDLEKTPPRWNRSSPVEGHPTGWERNGTQHTNRPRPSFGRRPRRRRVPAGREHFPPQATRERLKITPHANPRRASRSRCPTGIASESASAFVTTTGALQP